MSYKTPYNQLKRKILFEHLEKYKDTPSRTIAKILARDYPDFFKDVEEARGHVRTFRGSHGVYLREVVKTNQFFKI